MSSPESYSPSLPHTSVNYGTVEPGPCIFSTPKSTYSTETRDYVRLLMNETRLTMTQRHGFESLLRSNDPSTTDRSTTLARRQEYMRRRFEKGRSLGLDMSLGHTTRYQLQACQGGGKRTLETIQATGVLQPEPKPRTYIPVNKELEKVRFSYKMAYGMEPSPEVLNRLIGVKVEVQAPVVTPSEDELKERRLQELTQEIGERVEFLESMKLARKDKSYRASMTFQIRQKLNEVKGHWPTEVDKLVKTFRLDQIDPVFLTV